MANFQTSPHRHVRLLAQDSRDFGIVSERIAAAIRFSSVRGTIPPNNWSASVSIISMIRANSDGDSLANFSIIAEL
jgi:hypothetical protein